MSCHRDIPDEILSRPVQGLDSDVHTKHGFSCSDCHGGDSSAFDDFSVAHSSDFGFRGSPGPLFVPQFCARCHSDPVFMKRFNPNISVDQLRLYRTSIHGIRNDKGDAKVAHCVSCHGVHGIRPSSDPLSPVYPSNVPGTCSKCHEDKDYMKAYGIPTTQMSGYRSSVHGIALLDRGDRASPACNDCHGNHGATPPGVASVFEVCGHCHVAQASLFSASPHREVYATMNLPACEACHGNHEVMKPDDSMIGVSEGSVCITCHEEGSDGYVVARRIGELISGLSNRHASAVTIINRAEQAGMMMDEVKFEANEARNALVRARTAIHTFIVQAVEQEVAAGEELLTGAEKSANMALHEISSRRKGLGLLIVVAGIMIAILFRKMRQADKTLLED